MEWAEVSQYNENDATWSNSVRRAIKLRKQNFVKQEKTKYQEGLLQVTQLYQEVVEEVEDY